MIYSLFKWYYIIDKKIKINFVPTFWFLNEKIWKGPIFLVSKLFIDVWSQILDVAFKERGFSTVTTLILFE